MKKIFHAVGREEVTRAVVGEFAKELMEYARSDVIVVGGGPSGLMAAKELAKEKVKVLIVERNNYLGGGFWLGGYMMNKLTVREPSQEVLKELGVPYKEAGQGGGLYVADAPHCTARLITAALDAGAKVLNMTSFRDVVLREAGCLEGVVVNWTAVSLLPEGLGPVDPIALESRLVIDASGHEACVAAKLEERGVMKCAGMGALWVDRSEELVVEHTGEAFPGLIVVGMSVSTVYGLPRMGPTFGAMLLSGKKGAEVALEKLKGSQKG